MPNLDEQIEQYYGDETTEEKEEREARIEDMKHEAMDHRNYNGIKNRISNEDLRLALYEDDDGFMYELMNALSSEKSGSKTDAEIMRELREMAQEHALDLVTKWDDENEGRI